jgi:uncharacterized protein (DUF1330 family)
VAAICVGHIRVRNAEAWEAYRARVGATVVQYGGELLFRGNARECFAGERQGDKVVALRFPDLAAARRWHDSPEYQALVALRDEGADVTLELFEEQEKS